MVSHEQTLQQARNLFIRLHNDERADVVEPQAAAGIEIHSVNFLNKILENARNEPNEVLQVAKALLVQHLTLIAHTDLRGQFGVETLVVRVQQPNPDDFYVTVRGRDTATPDLNQMQRFNLAVFAASGPEISIYEDHYINVRIRDTEIFPSAQDVDQAITALSQDERAQLGAELLDIIVTQILEDAFPLSPSDVPDIEE